MRLTPFSRGSSELLVQRAGKVSRAVKDSQDFDPAGDRALEDQVVFELLDASDADVAQAGIIGFVWAAEGGQVGQGGSGLVECVQEAQGGLGVAAPNVLG